MTTAAQCLYASLIIILFGPCVYAQEVIDTNAQDSIVNTEPIDSLNIPYRNTEAIDNPPVWKTCDTSLSREQTNACTYAAISSRVAKKFKLPRKKIDGKIYVQFVVNQQGKVDDIIVLKGTNEKYDKAAINAVKSLPDFYPATHKGRIVSVMYIIPFEISSE